MGWRISGRGKVAMAGRDGNGAVLWMLLPTSPNSKHVWHSLLALRLHHGLIAAGEDPRHPGSFLCQCSHEWCLISIHFAMALVGISDMSRK